jgi:hypothetical protein
MSGPQPGHVRPLNLILGYLNLICLLIQVLESYPRHVWTLAQTCLASQPYHGLTQPYLGSREVGRHYKSF